MTERTLRFNTPADDVDTVQDFLEALWEEHDDVAALDRMAFETAIAELAANVIQHADGGSGVTCVLTVDIEADGLRATLKDTAEAGGFALRTVEMPDVLAEDGRGIALIQALVDDLAYDRVDGVNRWTISRRRSSAV